MSLWLLSMSLFHNPLGWISINIPRWSNDVISSKKVSQQFSINCWRKAVQKIKSFLFQPLIYICGSFLLPWLYVYGYISPIEFRSWDTQFVLLSILSLASISKIISCCYCFNWLTNVNRSKIIFCFKMFFAALSSEIFHYCIILINDPTSLMRLHFRVRELISPVATRRYAIPRFYLLEDVFCVIFSTVIFIIRWKNSSLLLIVVCLVRNTQLGFTFFHFFSRICILFWISHIVSVLLVYTLRSFLINVGYYVYWNVVAYRSYLLCRGR